jgi:formylglycine-generating enzyme required for sulfatase activity
MILVPGGPFLAPTDGTGRRLGAATLPDFAIARFPVTVREFAVWLDDLAEEQRELRRPSWLLREAPGAWRLERDWISPASAKYLPPGRELDLPMIEVFWYDAARFARWAAERTARPFRLPSSLEWDKAARGADGRMFPMGNELDGSFAKIRESRPEVTQPEPVGAFPLDESPYGVRDLAGGVGDWTSTLDDDRPPPRLEEEGCQESDDRAAVWRGGYWSFSRIHRSALRFTMPVRSNPRVNWIGFRLAMSLEGPSSSMTTEPMERAAPTTLRS